MMIKLFKILPIVFLLLVLSQCKKNDDPIFTIEFLVLDSTTGLPVEGAQIQLLEDGVSVTTQAEGTGSFSEHDLDVPPVQSITDSVAYAFSVRHSDFRPRELNAGRGKTTVELIPTSSQTHTYHKPVQLDDGLKTAGLSDAGLDTDKIGELMNKIAESGYSELHSILIYKDGLLVLEEYYYGNNDTIQFENNVIRDRSPDPIWWSRNGKHYVASVNKALTSTLAGIALEANGLTTDAPLKDFLPGYASYFDDNPNKSAVTFHHALNMTLGFQWNEWGSNDLSLLWKSDDFADFLLSRANNGPGSTWVYNSASHNIILKSLENMVGEPVRNWAQTRFYSRLGIDDYTWQSQPDGYPEGAARMYLRPRDMLKIGVTYLNGGNWNGDQVIPASWVAKCLETVASTASGNYSHSFWIRELNGINYLSADGDGGNYINIFPDQNMVIVLTQGNYLQWPLYVNQADDIMGNYIFPAIE
ncbi:MAG: class C beta-lactamase-related serine hydrolase [Balneolaceae bacterium]|nr:MAG: class C beta-lactamase-related serine hydrolase [Balneolaceae bacterium]